MGCLERMVKTGGGESGISANKGLHAIGPPVNVRNFVTPLAKGCSRPG